MRKDLKDVLVDTGRYKSGGRGKYKGRCRDPKKNSEEYRELDKLPSKKFSKEPSDRFMPVVKFLVKNKDRPWNDVWSEVCAKSDNRNVRGYHLRDHILGFVDRNGISKEYPSSIKADIYTVSWRPQFYVDDKGILRVKKAKK